MAGISDAREAIRSKSFSIDASAQSNQPVVCHTKHTLPRLTLAVHNNGYVGSSVPNPNILDCLTGEILGHGVEFPAQSNRRFWHTGAIWVGGVIADDTLVSHAADGWIWASEMGPAPVTPWVKTASLLECAEDTCDAVSEEDYTVYYTDTAAPSNNAWDPIEHRPHEPLNLFIKQSSYAWSYAYASDFVFVTYEIANIGSALIRDAWVGIFNDGAVAWGDDPYPFADGDDLAGFLTTYDVMSECGHKDSLIMSWIVDNDGNPYKGEYADEPVYSSIHRGFTASNRGVVGVLSLPTPGLSTDFSLNWWVGNRDPAYDYGPMKRVNYRDFNTGGMGVPMGDRNKYYVMSNREVDPDQARIARIAPWSEWIAPRAELGENLAHGADVKTLVSRGPYDIAPGARITFTIAVVGGENFHQYPENINNLPSNPAAWYDNVDFSDLARNADWAQRIYDNPGVDTDNDGYAGEYRVCVLDSELVNGDWVYNKADTQWYKGDGVPDWRAAGPPTPPEIWLEPIENGFTVRFNGQVTETSKDILTHTVDFEGYRVYLGRDEREASYSLIASYDIEDFDKYVFDATSGDWSVRRQPFTLEELRCLYADSCGDTSFDPVFYTRVHPYVMGDSAFYFQRHGRNVSALGESTPITKRYPDMVDPRTLHPDSISDTMYTDDGYLKFYEYEMTIENMLATVPYWINVTAFDFGSPESGLQPLESSVTLQAKSGYPLHPLDAPVSGSDEVYVYPNPYRIDAQYRLRGYEGRTRQDRSDDRVRAIWFANLPPVCTIELFTIDGDLVRRLEHDMAPSDPNHRHHRWDLINRNAQRIVSGLYYWVVEVPGGKTQMGKLVIIR